MKRKGRYRLNLKDAKYEVYGGGGVTGIAYLYAIEELEKKGKLKQTEGVGGTSSGAIFAGMRALGYTPRELIDTFKKKNLKDFASLSLWEGAKLFISLKWASKDEAATSKAAKRVQHLAEASHKFENELAEKSSVAEKPEDPEIAVDHRSSGLFSGAGVYNWVAEHFAHRTGKADITFGEFKELRDKAKENDLSFFEQKVFESLERLSELSKIYDAPEYKPKDSMPFTLQFVESALGDERLTRPEQLTSIAHTMMTMVRSMKDISVVATEVVKDPETGEESFKEAVFNAQKTPNVPIAKAIQASAAYPYVFSRVGIEGKIYTDGGLTNIVPLNLFQDPRDPNFSTLGFALCQPKDPNHPEMSRSQISTARQDGSWMFRAMKAIGGFLYGHKAVERARAAFNDSMDKVENNPRYRSHVIEIDYGKIEPTDFTIGDKEREFLKQQGITAAEAAVKREVREKLHQLTDESWQAKYGKESPPPSQWKDRVYRDNERTLGDCESTFPSQQRA